MAIGPLPPVISEIQANSGQPGKTLAQQTAASSLLDLQATATTEPATAILPETTLIEKAMAEALGRQGGLAPLYATLAELADASDLPDAVKAAVDTILAFRLGDGDVTPARVAEAIRSSGVFHEAVAAGKMAASLPPAVRQALGGMAGDGRQATARPVALAAAPVTAPATARQVSASPTTALPIVPMPVSAAVQVYGRQGGLPAAAATPLTPQQASGGDSVTGSPSMLNVPDVPVAAAPTNSPAAPSASASLPSANTVVAPALVTMVGETSPTAAATTVVSAPALPPVVESAREGAAFPPTPAVLAGGQEVHQVPSIDSGAIPALLSSPVSPATPAVVGQLADPLVPVSGNAVQPPAPPSVPTVGPSEEQVPTQPTPTVSSVLPANASAASRSFAPWTPGRPFIPAVSAAASTALAGSSSETGHTAAFPAAAPAGGEMVVPRTAGDRAPFVPSTVDSLPNAPPEPGVPRATAGPAALSHAQDVPAQPGTAQSPAAAAFSSHPGSGPTVGQTVPQPEQQSAPQPRPMGAAGVEISATQARQSTLPISQPTTTMPPMAGVDLKGALEVLRRELVTWLGRNADVMASLDGASDAASPRLDRPQPPRKNSPVRGQPAVPLLGEDDSEAVSTETLAGRALGEAERSLSRVFLHQAATAESRDLKAAQPTQALMLEIPIVGPNGTSVAQLRIERDDHASNEPGAPPRRVFQVDIAFDIAPLGPVAVRVGLMDGRRVAVGVWCESDDGLVRMEAERENIVLGLEQEGMVVAGVDLHRGHPSEGNDEMAAAPNHRLDLQL